jgi:methylmalonyl-CoA mutase N-terminal domain/subunit
MIAAVETGFIRSEIADAAFAYQRDVDARRKLIVGVNQFTESDDAPIEVQKVHESVEHDQVAHLRRVKEQRSQDEVSRTLAAVCRAAEKKQNLMPTLLAAARARATVGETINALADVLGRHPATIA